MHDARVEPQTTRTAAPAPPRRETARRKPFVRPSVSELGELKGLTLLSGGLGG